MLLIAFFKRIEFHFSAAIGLGSSVRDLKGYHVPKIQYYLKNLLEIKKHVANIESRAQMEYTLF